MSFPAHDFEYWSNYWTNQAHARAERLAAAQDPEPEQPKPPHMSDAEWDARLGFATYLEVRHRIELDACRDFEQTPLPADIPRPVPVQPVDRRTSTRQPL